MFVIIYTLVLILLEVSSVHLLNDQYTGDQVWQLTPHSSDSLQKLAQFTEQNELDVWHGTAEFDKPCEVRITQSQMTTVKHFCEQQNIDVSIMIPDLKKTIDENVASTLTYTRFNYTNYNQYNKILCELVRLCHMNYRIMSLRIPGYSYEGRPLVVVKISNNLFDRTKKIIWIDAGIHAREWITVAAGMFMLKEMLRLSKVKGSKVKKLLDDHVIYFVPVFNPDGYEYSFTKDRLWRKTRSHTSNPECPGVDANRNWKVKWSEVGSSSDPCSLTYHGPFPESEHCVFYFARYLDIIRHRLKAYFSLHSFFQLLLLPNSYTQTPPKDFPEMVKFARTFRTAVKKRYKTDYAFASAAFLLGAAGGVSADYVHDQLNVTHAYAVELRDRGTFGFLLPPDQIQPTAEETLDAITAGVLAI